MGEVLINFCYFCFSIFFLLKPSALHEIHNTSSFIFFQIAQITKNLIFIHLTLFPMQLIHRITWPKFRHTTGKTLKHKSTLEREIAAGHKTVGWYFLQGLVYRTGWARKKNCKTQQQNKKRPLLKENIAPALSCWVDISNNEQQGVLSSVTSGIQ